MRHRCLVQRQVEEACQYVECGIVGQDTVLFR